ncbi:MAG: ABC transporter permease [Pirellulales bacterium]|nr:ABC transporter permease [Pirellulales bacterium]
MVLEQELLPYFQWLINGGEQQLGALPTFVLVCLGLAMAALVVGFTIAAGRYGLMRGGDATYKTVASGVTEMVDTSPRRIWALARLAIKESMRRRVIVALGVFFLFLLFANWFLKTNTQDPARLYLSVVLTATTYLVLIVALLLSAFSLPGDFKSKTIYTVVTKPVRAGEIILGRIIGFSIVATVLLAIMAVTSYIFVVRSLDHTHEVDAASITRITDAKGDVIGYEGQTTKNDENGHRHDFEVDVEGVGQTDMVNSHTHNIDRLGDNDYQVSGPIGFIRARVPQYGKLRFIDRSGAAKDTGISVGSEWTYRSFIDGNTPATAIWTFDNIRPGLDPEFNGLPLALLVRVFKTHKGTIGQDIGGQIQLRNPETGVTSQPIPFGADDAQVVDHDIPNELQSSTDEPIKLFDDLVSKDGKIEVLVKCLERGQYFGFAQADCYIRHPDGSPLASYAKVVMSIWVQAIIVIAVGVTISTIVSGPVALLFTAGFIILGFWRQDFVDIATGVSYGGGPAESVYRIATQANVMVKLDEGILTSLLIGFDTYFAKPIMWAVAQCLPDFRAFSTVDYAADGYNVPWDRVFQDVTVCLGYVVGLAIFGYFLLRTREIAR